MWYFSNYVNESDVCVWQTGSNDTGFERVKCWTRHWKFSKIEMLASEAYKILNIQFKF